MLQALRHPCMPRRSRLLSSATMSSWALRMSETGKPQDVLSLVQEELPARLKHDEVLLDILAVSQLQARAAAWKAIASLTRVITLPPPTPHHHSHCASWYPLPRDTHKPPPPAQPSK